MNEVKWSGAEDVVIREFQAGDQDAVRKLVLSGLKDHWGDLDPELNQDLLDIAGSYRDGRTVVADLEGTIVGTGTIVRRAHNAAEIVRMSIHPSCRRRGLGKSIAIELTATARRWGLSRVVLETSSHWTDVVAFYVGCGFTLTHEEDGAFGRDTWFELRLD